MVQFGQVKTCSIEDGREKDDRESNNKSYNGAGMVSGNGVGWWV